ncbi:MAG: hypothetical protein MUE41_09165 [Gemmatimonadaceae bacterium]|nr:hypothetical protein [Gemmatimonadaceae bacterium]
MSRRPTSRPARAPRAAALPPTLTRAAGRRPTKGAAGAAVFPLARNAIEYIAIVGWWGALVWLQGTGRVTPPVLALVVIAGCWIKTALFGVENLRQLVHAARTDMAHHRFLLLMAVNISQMTLAFAFDFHVLWRLSPKAFSGIAADAGQAEALFDLFYMSVLNFTFFGFSDVLPQSVPARIINLTEIFLAFGTVIFLLSDFISLKESLRQEPASRSA